MEIGTDTGTGSAQKERQYYQLISYPSRSDGSAAGAISLIPYNRYNTQYPSVTATGAMTFNMVDKPTGLLYPFPGVTNIEIATVFTEDAVEEPAAAYRFYARFLQYDITQGYNYVVNSPTLTR